MEPNINSGEEVIRSAEQIGIKAGMVIEDTSIIHNEASTDSNFKNDMSFSAKLSEEFSCDKEKNIHPEALAELSLHGCDNDNVALLELSKRKRKRMLYKQNKNKKTMKPKSQRRRDRKQLLPSQDDDCSSVVKVKANDDHKSTVNEKVSTKASSLDIIEAKVVRLRLPTTITTPASSEFSTNRVASTSSFTALKTLDDDKNHCKIVVPTSKKSSLTEIHKMVSPLLIRIVQPYVYTFVSNVKGRWIGRTVYDVYCTEFGSYPPSYYQMAIEQGRIRASGRSIDCSYKIQNGDTLSHTVHRHEPAVAVSASKTGGEYDMDISNHHHDTKTETSLITIVGETNSLLAIDKPSTMPVHPCGGYHKNSLMSILETMVTTEQSSTQISSDILPSDDISPMQPSDEKTTNESGQARLTMKNDINNKNCNMKVYGKLYTIHRLDRLTSGLVILGKTSQVAKEWGNAIQGRGGIDGSIVEKLYLARVRGKFGSVIDCTQIPNLSQDCRSLMNTASVDGAFPTESTHNEMQRIQLPVHGEWRNCDGFALLQNAQIIHTNENVNNIHRKLGKSITGTEDEATIARRKNAVGFWITDHRGNVLNDISLTKYASIGHSVDGWLEILRQAHDMETTKIEPSSENSVFDENETPYLWFHLVCPVRIEQPKIGVCSAGSFHDLDDNTYLKTVKSAHTSFAVVKYNPDDDTTVVLVRPHTGRTHQIRIHLQFLSYPIANDPNYGGTMWFGNPFGEALCREAQKILDYVGDSNNSLPACENDKSSLMIIDEPATENEIDNIRKEQQPQKVHETLDEFVHRTCVWCTRIANMRTNTRTCYDVTADDRAHLEFFVRSPGLWLHALQYTVKGTTFKTEVPEWSRK